jgi:hypothetical protein
MTAAHTRSVRGLQEISKCINRVLLTAESASSHDEYFIVKEKNYKITEEISSLAAVNEYIGTLCKRLYMIYVKFGLDIAELEPETSKTGVGQVQLSNIQAVLENGNLRERMALLMNIACGRQKFLWCILHEMHLPPRPSMNEIHRHINSDMLLRRTRRAYLMTGIRDYDVLAVFADETSQEPGYREMPNRILDFPRDGSVLLSRLGAWPMCESLRTKRSSSERSVHSVPVNRIYPKLSENEIMYMKRYNVEWHGTDATVPWETGLMVWTINNENFYARLARRYNQEVISGPSGTTDGILELAELFDDFDLELVTLSCVAFTCGAHHHSAWEVLLAALPFGLQYCSEIDAYDFVRTLISKRKSI